MENKTSLLQYTQKLLNPVDSGFFTIADFIYDQFGAKELLWKILGPIFGIFFQKFLTEVHENLRI